MQPVKVSSFIIVVIYFFVTISANSPYDKNINVFSNKGELLQVEYALNAGQKGSPLLAVKSSTGEVVLCVPSLASIGNEREYDQHDSLLDRRAVDKVCRVDDKTWIAFSGLSGDGRYITKQVRSFSIGFHSKFGCSPAVGSIARFVGELQHESTITRGKRPFGVQILLIGFDEEMQCFGIYRINPSGEITSWKAVSIGQNSEIYMRQLESRFAVDHTNTGNVELGPSNQAIISFLETVGSAAIDDDEADSTDNKYYRFHLSDIAGRKQCEMSYFRKLKDLSRILTSLSKTTDEP